MLNWIVGIPWYTSTPSGFASFCCGCVIVRGGFKCYIYQYCSKIFHSLWNIWLMSVYTKAQHSTNRIHNHWDELYLPIRLYFYGSVQKIPPSVQTAESPSEKVIPVFYRQLYTLTHWGRVTHICVNDLTIIGSANGLSPGRRQAIIRTNAGILLFRP